MTDIKDAFLQKMVAKRVDIALLHQFRCELGDPATGKAMAGEQRRKALTALFGEIAKGMGVERFAETPVERLDQFAVMSVVKNHDTAGLLRSLVNSFMIAYANPETSDRAFKALLNIEALRAEVGEQRGQPSNNQALLDAADELDKFLCQALPTHSISTPRFRILIGADRLFVMSAKPIKNLPSEINGVPVEPMINDFVATAQ